MARIGIGNLLIKRQMQSNAQIVQNCKEIRNRNPRNLERLRIARKPIGYALDKLVHSYWHRLVVTTSQRYVSAEIHHFENGPVITASTQEWGLRNQLFRTNDTIAYKFVGRVLAQRCLECGIVEIYVHDESITGNKTQILVDMLKENGILLEEPSPYKHPNRPTVKIVPEKPWKTFE